MNKAKWCEHEKYIINSVGFLECKECGLLKSTIESIAHQYDEFAPKEEDHSQCVCKHERGCPYYVPVTPKEEMNKHTCNEFGGMIDCKGCHPDPALKEEKVNMAFIQCRECKQQAPIIKGEYRLVHSKGCSRDDTSPAPTEDWAEKAFDEMVRDFTAQGFMPKSEARRRFKELIAAAREDENRRMLDKIGGRI